MFLHALTTNVSESLPIITAITTLTLPNHFHRRNHRRRLPENFPTCHRRPHPDWCIPCRHCRNHIHFITIRSPWCRLQRVSIRRSIPRQTRTNGTVTEPQVAVTKNNLVIIWSARGINGKDFGIGEVGCSRGEADGGR